MSVRRCAAAAMGLAPDSSPVVPTSITTMAGTPCSTPNAPTCCCNMASLVQFNMVAPNTAVADAYAAAMPNNLTGPAMVQCLQVSVKPGISLLQADASVCTKRTHLCAVLHQCLVTHAWNAVDLCACCRSLVVGCSENDRGLAVLRGHA